MQEMKNQNKYKNQRKTVVCASCGKEFTIPYSSGTINCPDCSKDKKSSLERPYTRDTVFLVCKWYDEGMKIKRIANLLQRSEDNIRKALKRGGRLKTAVCVSCGKEYTIPHSSNAINCPDCSKNKNPHTRGTIAHSSDDTNCPDCPKNTESSPERPYTSDTISRVCKLYDEGMSIKKIASLQARSEESIRKALTIGGRLRDE